MRASVYMYVCVRMYVRVCARARVCVCMYVYVDVYTCMRVLAYVCVHVWTHMCECLLLCNQASKVVKYYLLFDKLLTDSTVRYLAPYV